MQGHRKKCLYLACILHVYCIYSCIYVHMGVHICAYVFIRAHIVRLRDLAAKDMHTYEQYEHIVPYTSMNEYIQRYIQNIYKYNKLEAYERIQQSVFAYVCLCMQSYIHIQANVAKIHTYTGIYSDRTCYGESCGDIVCICLYVFIYACIGNSQRNTVHVSAFISLYLSVYVCI